MKFDLSKLNETHTSTRRSVGPVRDNESSWHKHGYDFGEVDTFGNKHDTPNDKMRIHLTDAEIFD